MAMPSEDPAFSNVTSTGNFHQHFRRRISTLQEQIDGLALASISASDRKSTIDLVRVGIAKLSSELADASGDLPSYDQRSYTQAIKDLQDKVAAVQASHAPKAKFSFKNKRLAAPVSESNSVTTSRSVTPTHLRDPDSIGRGHPTPAFASPSAHVLSDQDDEQHDEASRLVASSADSDHLDVIDSGKNAYVRWPTNRRKEDNRSAQQLGKTCVVSGTESCIVNINSDNGLMHPSALTLSTIANTLIIAPDVRGAAHITSLRNSILILSCHQFRMHDSKDVDVYLYCPNRPIIEDCSNIRFTRLPAILQSSSNSSDIGIEGTATRRNMFDQVDDFKWLRTEASPNWRTMQEEESIDDISWQNVLEVLSKLDGGMGEDIASEAVEQVLERLAIRTGS